MAISDDATGKDSAAPGDPLTLRNRALAATAEGVTISDCRLPDNPIIYCNAGFERLTGYAIADVIGRNCRFLQGPGTTRPRWTSCATQSETIASARSRS